MIVKMKRVTIIGLKSHKDKIISQLRSTGVVHVRHVNPPESPSLEKVADSIFLSETALQKLPFTVEQQIESPDIRKIVDEIVREGEALDFCEDRLATLEQEAQRIAFLGPFNSDDIKQLRERGIFIRLYELPKKKNSYSLSSEIVYRILGESQKRQMVIAVVSYKTEQMLPLSEFAIPAHSIQDLETQIEHTRNECKEISTRISSFSMYRKSIRDYLSELKTTRDFELVRNGVGDAEALVYIQGYCPVTRLKVLRESGHSNSWGLLIEDPAPGEEPPTLIQNPRWVQIITPVFRLLNTLPGYHELDISGLFLLFFSIFFGMLIGDAGYGFLFLAVIFVVHKKIGAKLKRKEPFYLMYVLSGTTIVWGAMTGSWFGIESLTHIAPFNLVIIPGLNAYVLESQRNIMSICFYIAALHLSLAHIVVIFKEFRVMHALANFGWVMMVLVMFFIAQNQVLGAPLPPFFVYLFAAAILFIVVFSLLDRKPGKGLAEVLIADIVLATINTFSDTISYIRLFAVGLATLAVAQSFNEIALQVGFGNLLAALGSGLILVLGHSLNIALAAMAVIVHGIRLNMLEFSGHVGNTWSGYQYDPFKVRSKTDKT